MTNTLLNVIWLVALGAVLLVSAKKWHLPIWRYLPLLFGAVTGLGIGLREPLLSLISIALHVITGLTAGAILWLGMWAELRQTKPPDKP